MQSAVSTSTVNCSGDRSATVQHAPGAQGEKQQRALLAGRGNVSTEAVDFPERTPPLLTSPAVPSEHLTLEASKSKAAGSDLSQQSVETLDLAHNSQCSTPKRKRGRPPGSKSQAPAVLAPNLPKRKPGRPPKSKLPTPTTCRSDSMNQLVDSEEHTRRCGRPQKKNGGLDGSDSDGCKFSVLANSSEGGRSQRVKRKPNYDESFDDDDSNDLLEEEEDRQAQQSDLSQGQTVQKGRGRPRKRRGGVSQQLGETAVPDILGASAPRRRGRPPKDSSARVPQPQQQVSEEGVTKTALMTTASSNTVHPTVNGSIKDSERDNTSVSSPLQTNASLHLTKHSAPVPSSQRTQNDLEASFSAASPVEGRRSGRVRKRTLKGENLEDIISKLNRKKGDTSSERPAKLWDKSTSGEIASGQLKGKRGGWRKAEAVSGDDDGTEDWGEPSEEAQVAAPKRKRGRPKGGHSSSVPEKPAEEQRRREGKEEEVQAETDGRKHSRRAATRKAGGLAGEAEAGGSVDEDEDGSHDGSHDRPEQDTWTARERKKKPGRKAQQKMSIKSDSQTSTVIDKCLRCGESMTDMSSYKRHLQTRHAAVYTAECPEGEQTPRAWGQIFKSLKQIHCPQCRKAFRVLHYFKHHLKWCGREEERVVCERCERLVQAMWMEHHLRDHRHKDKEKQQEEEVRRQQTVQGVESSRKRKAATTALRTIKAVAKERDGESKERQEDGDWISDDESEYEDDNGADEDEENDSGGVQKIRMKTRHPRLAESDLADGRKISFPHVQNVDFFTEHQKCLAEQGWRQLHNSLLPQRRHWNALAESDASPYQPTTQQSVYFSVTQHDSGSGTQSDSVMQPAILHWGEVYTDDSQATAFAAGPVKAMEWCPLVEDGARGQVLALAAGRVMWEGQEVFRRVEGPGLIQFWSAGMLDCRQKGCRPALCLAFTLAHSAGHIVSLSWCPRGGYSDQMPGSEESLRRLGLLAVAGSDSNVLIYSIPVPEALPCDGQAEGAVPPTFRPPPSLTLRCANVEECGPCLSVAWQKGGDCDFIAGGYARGFVHLWHLSSTSPYVRLAANTLAPVRCFLAHDVGVMAISWSWGDAAHFATGGMDNLVRLWHSDDTRLPLSSVPDLKDKMKGPIRTVAFGAAALDGVIFADDQRDPHSGWVCAVDLSTGPHQGPAITRNVVTLDKHAATVWDLGYSDWFNVVASGNNMGLLQLASCWPVHKIRIKMVTKLRKGLPIFTTSCTDVKRPEDGDVKGSEDGASLADPPSRERLHVQFVDHDMKGKKNLVNTGEEHAVTTQTFNALQMADITAVCFNPNRASSQWLAAGTRAGFLRVLRLPCLCHEHRAARDYFTTSVQLHTPGGQGPTPGGHSPTPGGQGPTPGGHIPTPDGHSPTPGGHGPPLGGHSAIPGGYGPIPGGHSPIPGGHSPTPGGRSPTPGGRSPTIGSKDCFTTSAQRHTPGGQGPTPGGHSPTPAGHSPTPGSHSPTPGVHSPRSPVQVTVQDAERQTENEDRQKGDETCDRESGRGKESDGRDRESGRGKESGRSRESGRGRECGRRDRKSGRGKGSGGRDRASGRERVGQS